MASLAASQRVSAQASTSGRCIVAAPVRPALARRGAAAVRVRAAAQLPQGVTAPRRVPEKPLARFGFVNWAEKINGRAAMLGFFGILIVEAIAHKGVFALAGFEVGKGLGFEF